MNRTARLLSVLIATVVLLSTLVASAFATSLDISPDGFTPPKIKVAIVYSQTTIDWLNYRGTPGRYPHVTKESALLYYLQHRGYDVTEIVGDRDLNDATLSHYNVVVLNSMYGMGYSASEALSRYVANGGGLVASIGSPRVNPKYAPRHGVKDHLNEWWWRVMHEHGGLHYWEWGPLSSLFSEGFVNDGAYTPEYTLKTNPNSPVIQETQKILGARGYDNSIANINLHHPGANLEMSLKIPGSDDASSSADFNLLTPSVKRLYPKNYSAIMSSLYGAGRSVKFDYGATDYLENYSGRFYSPSTVGGYPQGEVGGALVEAAIIWAGTADGSVVAHSVDGTTYADVSAAGGHVTAKQRVINNGNTETRVCIRFRIVSPSGHTLKSWSTTNVPMLPHQAKTYSYSWNKNLPGGTCTVIATYNYGYPCTGASAVSQSTIVRGQTVRTH